MIEFQQKYLEDAKDLLEKLENNLLQFEKKKDDPELIQSIFRAIHNLKGSASMFGFDKVSELAHHAESIFDQIRNNELKVNQNIISQSFVVVDMFRYLLLSENEIDEAHSEKFYALIEQLKKNDFSVIEEKIQEIETTTEQSDHPKLFYILFIPHRNVIERGIRPLSAFIELKELGRYIVFDRNFEKAEPKEGFNDNYFFELVVIIQTSKSYDEVNDVFMFYTPDEYFVEEINNPMEIDHLFDIHAEKSKTEVSKNKLKEIQEKNSEIFILPPKVSENKEKELKIEQKEPQVVYHPTQVEFIRVESSKLDILIDLVSDMVTLSSGFNNLQKNFDTTAFQKSTVALEKLTKLFRDQILEMRMVPFNLLTLGFQRLVRDLLVKLSKEIDFYIQGENTVIDKNILNKLENPLMHILRNSIDHGIEKPDERVKSGKNSKGIIRLIIFESGANILVQIQDDGRGIDPERIRSKAIEKGFVKAQDKLSLQDIYELIFLPGFSTAQSLSDVSGRGVGMDVVRRNIGELQGEINIDSEVGLGTSVTIKIPISLAIIDTLMFLVGSFRCLIPISSVVSCNRTEYNKIVSASKQMLYKNQLISLFVMRDFLNIASEFPEVVRVIYVSYQDKFYGIVCDSIEGEQQVVRKPLGFLHNEQDYFSGVAIMGDGGIAYIIDILKLIGQLKNINDEKKA